MEINCKLICAAQASYAISPTDVSGQSVPSGANNPLYSQQYAALSLVEDPYIVIESEVNAALVCKTSTEIIIAFRGTLSTGGWPTFFDFLEDLLTEPIINPHLPGKVHTGFLAATVEITGDINTAVNALNPNGTLPIYITGHSKGGGMAPIAAMYLSNVYHLTIENIVTIAGPNPGNADFQTAFNSSYPNVVAFQNYLDIVPLLPPTPQMVDLVEITPDLPQVLIDLLNIDKTWDYATAGTVTYIGDKAKIALFPPPLAFRLGDIKSAFETNYDLILDAHHASCGFRYMQALCQGTVCKSS